MNRPKRGVKKMKERDRKNRGGCDAMGCDGMGWDAMAWGEERLVKNFINNIITLLEL